VSVSISTELTALEPIVQISDLDPRFMANQDLTLLGDATGGSATLTATVPAGYAALWCRASVLITGSPTITTAWWNFSFRNNAFYQSATISAVDTFGVASGPVLPKGLDFDWTTTSYLEFRCDNPDGDTIALRVLACLWDIVTARQLPQKFFWPYSLG